MSRDLTDFLIDPAESLRVAMARINANRAGIVLVVDGERCLIGTITDGDIRRAILDGIAVATTVRELLAKRSAPAPGRTVTASPGASPQELLRLMSTNGVRQVPLCDGDGRVVDLAIEHKLVRNLVPLAKAVIMAGGHGHRLQPLTERTPKPMLPMGDKPLLEHIVTHLRDAGIDRINITTHYQPESIREHFGDGSEFGVAIDYVHEDEPLGTAGALHSLKASSAPLLVMNGDVLTNVDLNAMLAYHREYRGVMTVAVREYQHAVPYGVIEGRDGYVHSLVEKPKHRCFINAGIYIIEPEAVGEVPAGKRFDMTDLIEALLAKGKSVASFPIHEYWADIGRQDDYERAQQDFREGKISN